MVNERFAKWATGFSGCDGGNLQGSIWMCGIEYGEGEKESAPNFDDRSTPPWVGEPHWHDRKEFLRYRYNWRAIKLLAAVAGEPVSLYKDFFKNQNVFDQHSNYFKLNLYPISFKNINHDPWPDTLIANTGLSNDSEYFKWCDENRFPRLRELVVRYAPKLILCTGIGDAERFRSAFIGREVPLLTTTAAGKELKYAWTNAGSTLVAIVYFLGRRYGLISDDQLTRTGSRVAELLIDRSQPA